MGGRIEVYRPATADGSRVGIRSKSGDATENDLCGADTVDGVAGTAETQQSTTHAVKTMTANGRGISGSERKRGSGCGTGNKGTTKTRLGQIPSAQRQVCTAYREGARGTTPQR